MLFDSFSGDVLDDQLQLPTTECLLYSEGSITCVPAMKFVAKCDPDYTYFPYDKYQCRITFGSWRHTGLEVDYQLNREGVCICEVKLIENYLLLQLFNL